jgi:hypothetical protein
MAEEFSLQALHDEIEADPEGLGYKEAGGEWKEDSVIYGLINDTALGDIIQREHISPQEIIEQIVITDLTAASEAERDYLALLPALPEISTVVNGSEVRNNLLSIFGAGTTTRTNLSTRDISPS